MKGITVQLYQRTQTGVDGFNRPIYEEAPVDVENVLVAPSSSDDIASALDLTGKKAVYTLGIPKGDSHDWEDKRVRFFGQDFRTFGFVTEGIEANIPLSWNKKVQVERYG
ncbi:MAG: hypothetical protein K5707_04195 [Clostridia bacterium]|nr:hypothetical protein [Clostridia bacterium]